MKLRAPEFIVGSEWLNCQEKLTLQNLRGRPVLLDFWTYCCINCVHTLDELRALEDEFSNEGLVVIGVHSPKFEHERTSTNVKDAIARHSIRHPVVIDNDHLLWDAYAVRAWPTLVLIDADGKIDFQKSGEGNIEAVRTRLRTLVQNAKVRAPKFLSDSNRKFGDDLALRFPQKAIAAKVNGEKSIFISDFSNNRVVEVSENGKVKNFLGVDALEGPQGMCVYDSHLYVCDTGNNRIVRFALDPSTRALEVVAGSGKRKTVRLGADYEPLTISINSPCDICVWNNTLVITCLGSHQLLLYSPTRNSVYHLAGSGLEDLQDGAAVECMLAQPSGICSVSSALLCFVDSETSSLRFLSLEPHRGETFAVQTAVGTGLFDFGFQDGNSLDALLQHPTGCVYSELLKGVVICDTYNNALRLYSTGRPWLSTLSIDTTLNEPTGISLFEGQLLIADSNHHRIVKIHERDLLGPQPAACTFIEGPFGVRADFPLRSGPSKLV